MATRATRETKAALDALVRTIEENGRRGEAIVAKARQIEKELAKSHDWATIVAEEEPPLIVELLTRNIEELHLASARFRRAEAHVLYEDGMTINDIASRFGVTRQRISTLLNAPVPAPRTLGAYRRKAARRRTA
jgi:hypothetical protein